jgi:hypothetical protein
MDGLGEEPRLMRVQYMNLVVQRARTHQDGNDLARDYAPDIEDGEPYEKERTRRRLPGFSALASRPWESWAPYDEELS